MSYRMFDNYDYSGLNLTNEMLLNNINNISKANELTGSYEGYVRGNIFNNLYNQYMNYRPSKLIPNSEEDEMLLNIGQICFYIQDLRLYLDNYPSDIKMIDLFNKNVDKLNILKKEYERKYGPICMDTLSNSNMFSWATLRFPWEGENE